MCRTQNGFAQEQGKCHFNLTDFQPKWNCFHAGMDTGKFTGIESSLMPYTSVLTYHFDKNNANDRGFGYQKTLKVQDSK